jgi:hypothetical protein
MEQWTPIDSQTAQGKFSFCLFSFFNPRIYRCGHSLVFDRSREELVISSQVAFRGSAGGFCPSPGMTSFTRMGGVEELG